MEGDCSAEPCPKCGAVAQFDQISGGQVCTSCGAVLEDVDLVQHVDWSKEGERLGVYIGATDTGERAGASVLGATVATLTGATSAGMVRLLTP